MWYNIQEEQGGALTGVTQLVGCHPTKPKVASSIPGQGTYKRQPIDVSLSYRCSSPSFSPSLPLSVKINK